MDVLVMLEESPDHSPVLAHVNTAPSSLAPERPARDIVTLYGVPNVELLALALAAAVESHRTGKGTRTRRHSPSRRLGGARRHRRRRLARRGHRTARQPRARDPARDPACHGVTTSE